MGSAAVKHLMPVSMDSVARTSIGWNLEAGYARLPASFFAPILPTPVRSPGLVILNEHLAQILGLDIKDLRQPSGIAVLAGNQLPPGSRPLAQAYAGHQFGHFTMLGDGRAILLGEQIAPSGERFDIQLKGAGQTPYSRQGDGRAALGPMLREYIISEAMHAIGIPTSRSLAVVTTGETVYRETALPGAILTRVMSSHLRVGTFEYVAAYGSEDEIRVLADYTIRRHFPKINEEPDRYIELLRGVIKRQAELVVRWQLVGFIHGVMNTDNMALCGETIDYGPCAFMDAYDPSTVFSSIDRYGRYAFRNQPSIAEWNLARFAETLLPLLHTDETRAMELAQGAVGEFAHLFHTAHIKGMRSKLGIVNEEPGDELLIEDLFKVMHQHRADFTNTLRDLCADTPVESPLSRADEFISWQQVWQARLTRQNESPATSRQLMRDSNPAVIPRNHQVEAALEAAVERGDYSVMEHLIGVLSQPYADTPEQAEYRRLPAPLDRGYKTFCGT